MWTTGRLAECLGGQKIADSHDAWFSTTIVHVGFQGSRVDRQQSSCVDRQRNSKVDHNKFSGWSSKKFLDRSSENL